jgi:hypothetical protein
MKRTFLRYAVLALALSVSISAIGRSQPTEIFFSEYVEGTSFDKALEIVNGTGSAINLASPTQYSIQMFFNGSATAGFTINLTGTVASGDVFVVAPTNATNATIIAAADQFSGTAWFNGDDAVVLRKGTTIIDVIGQIGFDPGSEWGTGLTSTADNTLRRKCSITAGDTSGSDAFDPSIEWDGFATNTFSGLGSHCGLSGVGAADPSSVEPGDMTLLTVTVSPASLPTSTGIVVTGDLSAIGGSATQAFRDDGLSGDVTAGDLIFSYSATVGFATTTGSKSLPATITDAQARTGGATIALSVFVELAIHDIQGSGTSSPVTGAVVRTTGIVTGVRFNNGFFIQEPDGSVDGDPATSEGIFVFTSSAPPAAAAVGNLVEVTGTVFEFIPSQDPFSPPVTEIVGPLTVSATSTGNLLPTAVTLTAADTDPSGSIEQLEKYEGMRVSVSSLTVVGPTQGSITENTATSTSNGVFYGVITGIARPFREPGIQVPDPLPAGSPCCVPRFDLNPERLRVDSNGQVGAATLEVATGANVTGLVGPLDYGFRTYTILPDPASPPAAVGGLTVTPVPARAADEFTVGSFNLERFFNDLNDAPDISGEPQLTSTAFANRLNKASLAIRDVLRSPDILGVIEIENLATLQSLAAKLNADDPTLNYVGYLEEGNDIGGIDVGFLVRSNRAGVVDVTQEGKTATFIDPSDSSVDLLNDRPPLVLRANITPAAGATFPVTVIVNHLRSLNDVDDLGATGERVREKRRKQAEFLANLIQTHETAGEHVISVGDYNAFQFNDGYVDSIGTIKGTPTPADQVVLASSDLVNPDLTDLVDGAPADQRYSYVFDGNAQVLDHILISANLVGRLRNFATARLDSDFPDSLRNDPNRPERISDHDAPVAYFRLPQLTALSPARIWVGLANSDDVGIRFDLRAEVYRNGTELVGSGELASAIGGSSGFNNAKLDTIPLTLTSSPGIAAGDTLSIKLLVRNACAGSGKNSGRARLWFNDAAANSRFDTTLDGTTSDWYLRDLFALAPTPGPGPKKTIDVQSGAKCSVYKPFGTWTTTLN